MNVERFYRQVLDAMAQPPNERHEWLCHLHTDLLDRYTDVLDSTSADQAAQPVHQGDDQRTLAQVVGHIAEWDRYAVLAAGDILAGLKHPRSVTSLDGYIEPDGTVLSFASIDDFNRYQAEKHASWSWDQIRTLACDTAQILHVLFSDEWLLNAQRLEQTLPWHEQLNNGVTLDSITMGWSLWLLQLEHLGADHTVELHLYDD